MKSLIIKYSLLLFGLLALFKSFEYAFFSYSISLDVYLGLVAIAFLLIGGAAVWYWQKRMLNHDAQPGEAKPSSSEPQPDPEVVSKFSHREREILSLLAHGYTNKELANMLDVSPNTVKTHLNNLYSKLEVSNRTQAVAEAKLLNLIT